jgi:tRNA U34 2-thiouridine synthase MnmA/TrmU
MSQVINRAGEVVVVEDLQTGEILEGMPDVPGRIPAYAVTLGQRLKLYHLIERRHRFLYCCGKRLSEDQQRIQTMFLCESWDAPHLYRKKVLMSGWQCAHPLGCKTLRCFAAFRHLDSLMECSCDAPTPSESGDDRMVLTILTDGVRCPANGQLAVVYASIRCLEHGEAGHDEIAVASDGVVVGCGWIDSSE